MNMREWRPSMGHPACLCQEDCVWCGPSHCEYMRRWEESTWAAIQTIEWLETWLLDMAENAIEWEALMKPLTRADRIPW